MKNGFNKAILENLGANIRECRKGQKMTQKELSEKSGIATITIKKIEAGTENITIQTLENIASGLKVYWLFLLFNEYDVMHLIATMHTYQANKVFSNNRKYSTINFSPNNYKELLQEYEKIDNYINDFTEYKGRLLNTTAVERYSSLSIARRLGMKLKKIKIFHYCMELADSFSQLYAFWGKY